MDDISKTERRGARCYAAGVVIDAMSALALVMLIAKYGVLPSIETRMAALAVIMSVAASGYLLIFWGTWLMIRAQDMARKPNH